MFESQEQPLKIAISAMGGQGGAVLAGWIRDLAEAQGYLAQSTSVPGVAQRTGATVYYLEIFPRAEAERVGKKPVLGMTPILGDVDILIAAELVEAGRAVQKGLVTPDKTTLITTTHRAYTVAEKQHLGYGLSDSTKILDAVRQAAKRCVAFDMEHLANVHGSVISSALFGALAGACVLPFGKDAYHQAIRASGVAVETSLAAFDAAYLLAEQGGPEPSLPEKSAPLSVPETARTRSGQQLLDRVLTAFPPPCQGMICEGMAQLIDYQDFKYATLYLDRLHRLVIQDTTEDYELTREVARYLALWMAFPDTIRVADQKIRRDRFQRIRDEVRATEDQLVYPVEYMHPRVEEFCDSLPRRLGAFVLASTSLRSFLSVFFTRGRKIKTATISGYILLYLLASLRFMRRASYRYAVENSAIEAWLEELQKRAGKEPSLALGLAEAACLIKGYGATRDRGRQRYEALMAAVTRATTSPTREDVRCLWEAALAGEEGHEFNAALAAFISKSASATPSTPAGSKPPSESK